MAHTMRFPSRNPSPHLFVGNTQKDGVRKRNMKDIGRERFILFYFWFITEIKGIFSYPCIVSYGEHKKIFLIVCAMR